MPPFLAFGKNSTFTLYCIDLSTNRLGNLPGFNPWATRMVSLSMVTPGVSLFHEADMLNMLDMAMCKWSHPIDPWTNDTHIDDVFGLFSWRTLPGGMGPLYPCVLVHVAWCA